MAKSRKTLRLTQPHLAHAFVCEKVLIEQDKVPSYVRAIDSMTLPTKGVPEEYFVSLNVTLVVALRPSERSGKGIVTLSIESVDPSRNRREFFTTPVAFGNEEAACATFAIGIHIQWGGEGLYWFDILVDSRKIGRIPLRLQLASTEARG